MAEPQILILGCEFSVRDLTYCTREYTIAGV